MAFHWESSRLYVLIMITKQTTKRAAKILAERKEKYAREFERAKKESFTLTCFTALLCVGLTAVLTALSGVFPLLYETTDEVRSMATGFIIITALFFPVQGVLNSLYFTLRSGGKTLVTFVFDSVFSWTVTLPLALALCFLTELPVLAVYAIVQAADIIKIVIGTVMIKKGVWITNLAAEFS